MTILALIMATDTHELFIGMIHFSVETTSVYFPSCLMTHVGKVQPVLERRCE